MKKKSAFTLVEIMIVIAIVGLLASLATLAILKAMRNSQIKSAETEVHMLATAMLQLAWDTTRWPNKALRTTPGSIEMWDLSVPASGLLDTDGSYQNWKGPYYEGNTKDPWGNNYFFDPDYSVDGVRHVVVGSFGPNGVGRNLHDSDDILVLLDD